MKKDKRYIECLASKINKKGQEIEYQQLSEQEKKRRETISKTIALGTLQERLRDMWEIAEILLKNGFRLGKTREWIGNKYYSLESDVQYHSLGFAIEQSRIIGFGVVGGGCCGKSILLNRNGEITEQINWDAQTHNYNNGESYCNYENPDIVGKIDEILKGFDEYEQNFYEFAESVVE